MVTVGRNAPCPCGSGLKFKKCCLGTEAKNTITQGAKVVEHGGRRMAVSNGVSDEALAAASDFFDRKDRGQGPAQQLADFTQPLIDAAGDDPAALQKALSLGAIFWNAAAVDDEHREELLAKIEATLKTEETRQDFRAMAATMLDRHRRMFPDIHQRKQRRKSTEGRPE